MPFVPSGVIALLAGCEGDATVTASEHALQPLLAMYTPAVLDIIDAAIAEEWSMRAFVVALGDRAQTIGPDRLRAFGHPELFMRDIDTPHELRRADAASRHTQHDTR